ncbi:Hypp7837 [Branchiostoma lanceolatum]|uniref:Hypp7837 protein n=1 Tax=Branchiostoma lanceolatum TaxID=7740 RepID=A0A8J9Z3U6_BRALA|nr:Hypp7837 [Branchiostoma lanceolatum]
MGVNLKLLLLLVIAVAIVSDEADAQGRFGRLAEDQGLRADGNNAGRLPRDLGGVAPFNIAEEDPQFPLSR